MSNYVRDQIINFCIDVDATLCMGGHGERWCCQKDTSCGSQYTVCREPSHLPSSLITIIVVCLTIVLILLLYALLHYLKECQRQQKVKYLSESNSIDNPLWYISTTTSTSEPLQTISATVNDSSV